MDELPKKSGPLAKDPLAKIGRDGLRRRIRILHPFRKVQLFFTGKDGKPVNSYRWETFVNVLSVKPPFESFKLLPKSEVRSFLATRDVMQVMVDADFEQDPELTDLTPTVLGMTWQVHYEKVGDFYKTIVVADEPLSMLPDELFAKVASRDAWNSIPSSRDYRSEAGRAYDESRKTEPEFVPDVTWSKQPEMPNPDIGERKLRLG